MDHYQISYAPSFSVLHHCQRRARSELSDDSHLFAVANPTGYLVWTNVEVERIARLFSKVRVLSGDEKDRATIATVMAEASNYAYIHFDCHIWFDVYDPLRSALRLTPPESLTLKVVLERLRLPRTRLVVLSASETGLVDPGDLADEYSSLAAGFLLAGAPAVVSSLWAIDDLTVLLMERFYVNHIGHGMSLPAALREAQIWLRDKVTAAMAAELCLHGVQALQAQGGQALELVQNDLFRYDSMPLDRRPFAHPFYWAAFTLMGT